MNALFVVLTDRSGGAERIASIGANWLAERGWHVDWVVMTGQSRGGFASVVLDKRVSVTYQAPKSLLGGAVALAYRLAGSRYDLAFTSHTFSNALLSLLRRFRLMTIGRFVSRESTTPFDRFRGLKCEAYRLMYRLYGAQDLIIVQTRYMAEQLRSHLTPEVANTIQTIPNPIDAASILSSSKHLPELAPPFGWSGGVNVLFCGKLEPVKRPDIALCAFAALPAGLQPHPRLIVVGSGSLELQLRKQVADLGLDSRVWFAGEQSNPFSIMSRCQVGLLTSPREGFPNVVLEMMAAGIERIVMTPCCGDLDSLVGVSVTRSIGVDDVSRELQSAIESGTDNRAVFRTNLADRTVSRFGHQLIGDNASAH